MFYKKDVKQKNRLIEIIKQSVEIKFIPIYILAIMMSLVKINGFAPFGLAICAASISSCIPIGVILILSSIALVFNVGFGGMINFLLTVVMLFICMLIVRPQVNEVENEKIRIGNHLLLGTLLVQILSVLLNKIYLYDLIASVVYSGLVLAFYKIFVNGIVVIKEYKYKRVFALEEVLGATIMIIIAINSFGGATILGISLVSVFSILIVLMMGWQNGLLVGATTGIIVGTLMAVISLKSPIIIAAYAVSGLIGSIFAKFGKIGVIVGFIIGNIALTYIDNGNLVEIILLKEIIIASIGLLAMPKHIKLKIDDVITNTKMLAATSGSEIGGNKKTIYKLNSMSDTIANIAKSYKEAAATIVDREELKQQEENNKKIFIQELQDLIEDKKENILYEDLYLGKGKVFDEIFIMLLNKDILNKSDFIEILENNNNFILGIQDEKSKANKDIKEMIKYINKAYKNSQVEFIWEKKEEDKNQIVAEQFEEVSKAISSIVDDMNNKKEKFEKEKEEIIKLLAVKEINVLRIKIEKQANQKTEIIISTDCCQDEEKKDCHLKKIKSILEKVMKEKLEIKKEQCGKRTNTLQCEFKFTSVDKFELETAILTKKKDGSKISGDSVIQMKLEDSKELIAISDGMGTGEKAKKSSQTVIDMLSKLLSAGFEKNSSVKIINSILLTGNKEEIYATLDLNIIDLYQGRIEFIKNGACPTFIKNEEVVQILKSNTMPAGLTKDIDLIAYEKDLKDGDILIMCSDGVLESCKEYSSVEVWLKFLLEEVKSKEPEKIANLILDEAKDNYLGKVKDDMTVVVAKIKEKSKKKK